jgi:5-formyltetrahydrofolate cyclo-ligase
MNMSPQQIRQHYRRLRANLSSQDQQLNAFNLARNVNLRLGKYKSLKVAAYLATQGEISLSPWIALQSQHQVFLPKLYEPIHPNLRFAEMNHHTRWTKNRFKITEPHAHWGETLNARQLDVILMPLVAFDRHGTRLGMGGGYYDRSLAFKRSRKHLSKPILIGIAHSIQEHPQLLRNQWDVGMDCIITEKEIIYPAQQ